MTTYAVLIYGDENAESAQDMNEQMVKAYWAYGEMLTENGAIKGGEALQPTSTATTIRVRDGKTLTTDGPFMETKDALGGLYLIQADDLDRAIELAAQCPGAASGLVELRPCVDFSQSG